MNEDYDELIPKLLTQQEAYIKESDRLMTEFDKNSREYEKLMSKAKQLTLKHKEISKKINKTTKRMEFAKVSINAILILMFVFAFLFPVTGFNPIMFIAFACCGLSFPLVQKYINKQKDKLTSIQKDIEKAMRLCEIYEQEASAIESKQKILSEKLFAHFEKAIDINLKIDKVAEHFDCSIENIDEFDDSTEIQP